MTNLREPVSRSISGFKCETGMRHVVPVSPKMLTIIFFDTKTKDAGIANN